MIGVSKNSELIFMIIIVTPQAAIYYYFFFYLFELKLVILEFLTVR